MINITNRTGDDTLDKKEIINTLGCGLNEENHIYLYKADNETIKRLEEESKEESTGTFDGFRKKAKQDEDTFAGLLGEQIVYEHLQIEYPNANITRIQDSESDTAPPCDILFTPENKTEAIMIDVKNRDIPVARHKGFPNADLICRFPTGGKSYTVPPVTHADLYVQTRSEPVALKNEMYIAVTGVATAKEASEAPEYKPYNNFKTMPQCEDLHSIENFVELGYKSLTEQELNGGPFCIIDRIEDAKGIKDSEKEQYYDNYECVFGSDSPLVLNGSQKNNAWSISLV